MSSTPRQLDSNQRAAAFTLDKHVSVTAGPGSGKTTVLVERYLHILREKDVSVDQIVAITFTNRAANEMRTRLRHELDSLMRQAKPDERAKWLRHKRTLDGAVITTFHGFCSRLLREFPVEAEIDPQFTLLDETQSAMLIEAVVEETLTEFINSGHEAITRLVVGVGRGAVAHAAVRIYRSMRNQGLTLSEIEDATNRSHGDDEEYSHLFQHADELMAEFISLQKTTPAVEKKRAEAASRWPQMREVLATIPDAPSLAEYCKAIDDLRAASRPTKSGKLSELVGSLDDVLWGEDKNEPFGRLPKLCFDHHAREFAREMIGVVRQVEQRLEDQKRALAALDFDDLIMRVLRLFDDRPDVVNRIAVRYRFFLVDEFQDTNGQQRELMQRLALSSAQHANLFIVGDRKQSIYGFRGADVDVFRAMTDEIATTGGLSQPLATNFRSQRPLIELFNHLFERVFQNVEEKAKDVLSELGYVEHEKSTAHRNAKDDTPSVELLIDVRDPSAEDGETSSDTSRERDAKQIAARILALVENEGKFKYRDIALLFRAMPNVAEYETVFRRHGIPYHTVQGKGFYAREEITDLLQLLRFLDNTTDEIALAAVLRSPLCGLSDDALLALRCAPAVDKLEGRGQTKRRDGVRGFLDAVVNFEKIAYINEDERPALVRARQLLLRLIERRSRSPVADLLRFAVEESEFISVVAANFDGAQRLANVWKMFELAERFERSGAHMIRDFVRFVEDFERAGGRESEGQIDESADAVLLMSIHQSKGQEFPVVVIPDITRGIKPKQSDWFMLDRHRGLTVKIPDGRGGMVGGLALKAFRERNEWRSVFESMRLFYVAATRTKDYLILSGASARRIKLDGKTETWLTWVMKALDLTEEFAAGLLAVTDKVQVNLFANLADDVSGKHAIATNDATAAESRRLDMNSIETMFPLLGALKPERTPFVDETDTTPVAIDKSVKLRRALHRFSVTQLLNFKRCPRQYFFDRILHTPSVDDLDVWNNAEAPEPPANLTATLRGAVMHRFCETYESGKDVMECLSASFDSVVAERGAKIGSLIELEQREAAIAAMSPLAENYLKSEVLKRIEAARTASILETETRILSEQKFVLRRSLGSLSGTIDKMLVTPNPQFDGVDVEIIDFKTDRFPKRKPSAPRSAKKQSASPALFELDVEPEASVLIREQSAEAAFDYELQMQAYALAVRELIPNVNELRVTIHFLDPNIEESLPPETLQYDACAKSVDGAMTHLLSSAPENYPPRTAEHCRFCNFREICVAGREWFRTQRS
jgi:ATP-dependent helicase/nuclease subunit A